MYSNTLMFPTFNISDQMDLINSLFPANKEYTTVTKQAQDTVNLK